MHPERARLPPRQPSQQKLRFPGLWNTGRVTYPRAAFRIAASEAQANRFCQRRASG